MLRPACRDEVPSMERNAAQIYAPQGGRDEEGLLRSGLKLGHMRMIVALADQLQVSAAAAVLNISQPAASRVIAEMEGILGVPLVERHARGIVLTPFGAALARRARIVLLEMRHADREIAHLKAGRGGRVSIGAVTAPAIDLVVPAVRKIRTAHPQIEINIQVESSPVLARELLAARHDFIIARIPEDLNPRLFNSRVIGIENASLIVRRGHPLLGKGRIGLDRLGGHDWVLQPSGSLLRRVIEAHFLRRDLPPPQRVLSTSSMLLTLVMVASTDAIAAVSNEVARFIRDKSALGGAIDVLPIDIDLEVQPYSLITANSRTLSPTARTFFDAILAEIR